MSDLAALKARIADELNRSDLTSQIASQIDRAVEKYADMRFWFNEKELTATLASAARTLTPPAGLRREDQVEVTIGGHKYGLRKLSWAEMSKRHSVSNAVGQPIFYSYQDGEFGIFPTSDQAYTMTVLGLYDEDELTSDASTNAWTNEAQDLICARVKYVLCRSTLFDKEGMEFAAMEVADALSDLRRITGMRQRTGRLRAYI